MPQQPPTVQWDTQRFQRLVELSVQNDYTPYRVLEWPEQITDDQWWMSKDLLSIYDTSLMLSLDEHTLKRLSKWESINFYSLNIHGIRELLVEVTRRIYTPYFGVPSDFFHRFIGEENDHMWFFAQFCLRYGSKIYPNRLIPISPETETGDPEVESFLVFSRILIFEEIVDYFNMRMAKDDSLHPLVQKINRIHHEDESRHIAGGRQLVKQLYQSLTARLATEQLQALANYLQRYMTTMLESLYNPTTYRDAGIPDAYRLRERLLTEPDRKLRHWAFVKRTVEFLSNNHIISEQFQV